MTDAVALETQKLDQLIQKTQQKILTIKTVFPFDLFPDTINVDENKVEIIMRNLFVEERIFPILISNITGVTISSVWIFAALKIEVVGHSMNPDTVRMLRTKDAIRAKRVIMGLVTAHKEGIDLSLIPRSEVAGKVEEIGRAHEHTNI